MSGRRKLINTLYFADIGVKLSVKLLLTPMRRFQTGNYKPRAN